MKLPEIKKLIKENNIKVSSIKNKQELINILIEHKVLPSDYVDKPQKETMKKLIMKNEKVLVIVRVLLKFLILDLVRFPHLNHYMHVEEL